MKSEKYFPSWKEEVSLFSMLARITCFFNYQLGIVVNKFKKLKVSQGGVV